MAPTSEPAYRALVDKSMTGGKLSPDEVVALEDYHIRHFPAPSYVVQIDPKTRVATTLNGTPFGEIHAQSLRFNPKDGSREQPFLVWATSGIRYFGVYRPERGTCLMVKRCKKQE